MIGACDICNRQNVELSHGYASGLETYYCANGCGVEDESGVGEAVSPTSNPAPTATNKF